MDRRLTPVAIALGSNLGDRAAHLASAVDRLRPFLTNLRISPFYDTDPVDVEPQPRFLNGAVTGLTALSARALLDLLLQIEREHGRERPHAGAPRTLDLDLLLYGGDVIESDDLQVPHRRFRDRLFVLEPLADIAAEWIDPVSRRTISALLRELRAKNEERTTERGNEEPRTATPHVNHGTQNTENGTRSNE